MQSVLMSAEELVGIHLVLEFPFLHCFCNEHLSSTTHHPQKGLPWRIQLEQFELSLQSSNGILNTYNIIEAQR